MTEAEIDKLVGGVQIQLYQAGFDRMSESAGAAGTVDVISALGAATSDQ